LGEKINIEADVIRKEEKVGRAGLFASLPHTGQEWHADALALSLRVGP